MKTAKELIQAQTFGLNENWFTGSLKNELAVSASEAEELMQAYAQQLQEENDRLKALVKELADIQSIDYNHQNLRLKAYRALNGYFLPQPPQK